MGEDVTIPPPVVLTFPSPYVGNTFWILMGALAIAVCIALYQLAEVGTNGRRR